jgi:hypothetical protein
MEGAPLRLGSAVLLRLGGALRLQGRGERAPACLSAARIAGAGKLDVMYCIGRDGSLYRMHRETEEYQN